MRKTLRLAKRLRVSKQKPHCIVLFLVSFLHDKTPNRWKNQVRCNFVPVWKNMSLLTIKQVCFHLVVVLYWSTEVKQANWSRAPSHAFLNLRHNSEHVDHVISGTGRPQENSIFRSLKTHSKIAFYPDRKIFSPRLIARNVGSDGKIKILTIWAL